MVVTAINVAGILLLLGLLNSSTSSSFCIFRDLFVSQMATANNTSELLSKHMVKEGLLKIFLRISRERELRLARKACFELDDGSEINRKVL